MEKKTMNPNTNDSDRKVFSHLLFCAYTKNNCHTDRETDHYKGNCKIGIRYGR
jgi:hypothetical protein